MKKLFYLLALTSCFAIGQTKAKPKVKHVQKSILSDSLRIQKPLPLGTSDDEYLYMTKGYKIQVESGLDMKRGYMLSNLSSVDLETSSFEFIGLKRVGGSMAGVIVVIKDKTKNKTYYLGIPYQTNGDNNLYSQYYNSLSQLTPELSDIYTKLSTTMLCAYAVGVDYDSQK